MGLVQWCTAYRAHPKQHPVLCAVQYMHHIKCVGPGPVFGTSPASHGLDLAWGMHV